MCQYDNAEKVFWHAMGLYYHVVLSFFTGGELESGHSIMLSSNLQGCLTMVSSVKEFDILIVGGSKQEATSTVRDTKEMVMYIKMVKTTCDGTMETKVKMVVKHCTCSTKTTLSSPQKFHLPMMQSLVAITTSTTTLPSPSSTIETAHKSQSGPTFVTSLPSVPHTSTSHIAVIPHPLDVPQPTSKPKGFYVIIVGQEWCSLLQVQDLAYDKGELHVIPIPSGPQHPVHMPSPALTEAKQSYWAEVDDLSNVFGQVQLDPTGNRNSALLIVTLALFHLHLMLNS
ncbi:hypothetical protein EDC04DRAFT_2605730 [Pisolithus marmoratus]|nr:hypothetical protein EDC04DRAFT_2605730 [Pisolithus marmoratus]